MNTNCPRLTWGEGSASGDAPASHETKGVCASLDARDNLSSARWSSEEEAGADEQGSDFEELASLLAQAEPLLLQEEGAAANAPPENEDEGASYVPYPDVDGLPLI